MRFVIRLKDGESMTSVCREFGISRKTPWSALSIAVRGVYIRFGDNYHWVASGSSHYFTALSQRYRTQPKARDLGINKKVSWHAFRHTFSTLLKANGEDVKVVQELLRHASAKMTLDTYS